MPKLTITAFQENWPIAGTFAISRGSRTIAEVVVVEISDGTHTGKGECVPYARYNETIASVLDEIASLYRQTGGDFTRDSLQHLMHAGAARNAVDCALWDLEAKQTGKKIHEIANLPSPKPLKTAFTLSLDTPEKMAEAAQKASNWPILKIKLGHDGDRERLAAIRQAAPHSRLIVDANEGWTTQNFEENMTIAAQLGVYMVEQPLPATDDAILAQIEHALPFCADESAHDTTTLPALIGKYDMINIKIGKTGGLTEALKLAEASRNYGLKIMAGCMVSTSLAIAPMVTIGQMADLVDLDGHLLLAKDRTAALGFSDHSIYPPRSELWG